LGVTTGGKPAPGQLHTPTFDPDERCIEIGMRASSGLLLGYLTSGAR